METIISKVAEQSLTIGVMMVMYYYQRLDKEKFMELFIESTNAVQAMQFAIDKLTDKLDTFRRSRT